MIKLYRDMSFSRIAQAYEVGRPPAQAYLGVVELGLHVQRLQDLEEDRLQAECGASLAHFTLHGVQGSGVRGAG